MRRALHYLYHCGCVAVFVVAMLLMYPLIVGGHAFGGRRGRVLSHLGFRLWGGSLLLTGLRLQIVGRHHLATRGPVLYLANHQSFLDTVSIFWAVRRPFKALGKVQLGRLPLVGLLFRIGCIMVDRDRAGSRAGSLVAMSRHFARGGSLLLYPEGRMNPAPPALQPFAEAGIRLAMRQGVTLQPMALAGTGRLLPARRFLIRPGRVRLEVGPPITAADYAGQDSAAVVAKIYSWIERRVG